LSHSEPKGQRFSCEGPSRRTGLGAKRLRSATPRRVPVHNRAAEALKERRFRRGGETGRLKVEIEGLGGRATGITNYLLNGGTLERAAAIAGHASTRTGVALMSVPTPAASARSLTTCRADRADRAYPDSRPVLPLVEPDEIERVKF